MSTEQLIHDWEVRLTKAQVGHYITAERFMSWHNITGFSLIVLSAFVSSFLFFDSTGLIRNALTIASVSCTVLAGIQIFIRPSEQAEIHRSRAVKYGILKRKIELFLSVDRTSLEVGDFLEDIEEKWSNIADNSPVTPRSLRKKAAEVLSSDFSENRELRKIKKG